MAIGASGSKGKTRQESATNQTQTNTLSPRAAGMLEAGISDAKGLSYRRFDPSTVGQYESPYTEDVIGASLDQAGQRDAIARNEQAAEFAGAGAFGDKRRGIYEAQLEGDQSRDRASLIAGLRDKSYGDAREIAQGENQNDNQMQLALQALLAQLRGGFANEGTQTLQGTNLTKGKTQSLGFTGAWGK